MWGITTSIMDKSLIIGAVILALALLGTVFQFLQLGLFSAGMGKKQAGIVSVIILLVAGFVVYQKLF